MLALVYVLYSIENTIEVTQSFAEVRTQHQALVLLNMAFYCIDRNMFSFDI